MTPLSGCDLHGSVAVCSKGGDGAHGAPYEIQGATETGPLNPPSA